MRRWLLVFLVLLLPLRGWVGEAMAGQMLQERMAQVQLDATPAHTHAQRDHHASPAHGAHHGAPAHDQDHAAAGTHGHHEVSASAPPGSAHGDCGTCAACQVCSSVALSPSVPFVAAGGFSQPRPEILQRAYTSAEALLAFKPPRG